MMKWIELVRTWWTDASAVMRSMLVFAAIAAVATGIFFLSHDANSGFVPLYSRLSPEDAAEIVAELKSLKIPYELSGQGSTILVDKNSVHQLRLDMASAGLPRGGGVGFEIFDRTAVMMTNFTQRVNFTRALQGELARTISQLPQVESARVHLALPKDSLFTREKKEPSASVYVKLMRGRKLSDRQIAGITHLVSTAIEGMSAERVTVLDGEGRLMGPPPDDGTGNGGTSRMMAFLHSHESRLENRLVQLLEPIVGQGRVVARVSAEMDLDRMEATEESFDPDGLVVKNENKTSESTASGYDEAGGASGASGNLPQPTGGNQIQIGAKKNSSARSVTNVNYAVPKKVKHISRALGSIKRLSVAVLIDSTVPSTGDTTEGEGEGTVVGGAETPAANANLNETMVAELVKSAVGFNETRGDRVEIMMTPFFKPEIPDMAAVEAEKGLGAEWMAIAGGSVALVVFMLGGTLFLHSRRKARLMEMLQLQQRREKESTDVEAPKDPAQVLRENVRQLARNDLKAAAQLMKEWIAA